MERKCGICRQFDHGPTAPDGNPGSMGTKKRSEETCPGRQFGGEIPSPASWSFSQVGSVVTWMRVSTRAARTNFRK